MTRSQGRLPKLATLFAAGAIVVAACSTPAASTGPTAGGATGAPPTGAATAAAAAAEAYPTSGEVTCGTGGQPGSFNGTPYTGTLKKIEAPDAATVVFTLCAPDVAFLQKMGFAVFGINDSAWIEKHAADGTIKDSMNGTGPYKLDEWRKGDSLIFSAFPDYWGDQPLVPNGVLKWSAESGARLQALQGKGVHGFTLVGPGDFDTVKNDAALDLATPPEGQNLNTLYLGMNHDDKPWDKVEVRKAIALALDRKR